jgi:hypothetical protein
MKKDKLKVTINEKYIPFDFSNLLTNEKVKSVFKQHGNELADADIDDIKKFLQLWLEVLYLQFKRQQSIENEQQQEGNIVYPSEYRRAS